MPRTLTRDSRHIQLDRPTDAAAPAETHWRPQVPPRHSIRPTEALVNLLATQSGHKPFGVARFAAMHTRFEHRADCIADLSAARIVHTPACNHFPKPHLERASPSPTQRNMNGMNSPNCPRECPFALAGAIVSKAPLAHMCPLLTATTPQSLALNSCRPRLIKVAFGNQYAFVYFNWIATRPANCSCHYHGPRESHMVSDPSAVCITNRGGLHVHATRHAPPLFEMLMLASL